MELALYFGTGMIMYQRNKDLILLFISGFMYYAIVVGLSGHLTKVPMGEYFATPFIVSCFLGFAVTRSSQMIEWPLCFLFGGTLGSLCIMGVLSSLGMSFNFVTMAATLSHTLAWFGMCLQPFICCDVMIK